jgi:uncharacterized membrane protein YagU involved in acid resistance
MWDFSISRSLGLMGKTLPFIIFRMAVYFGVAVAYVLATGAGAGVGWGALYGFAWWMLGGLILMPVLLGMPAFAPLMMEPMRPVAMGSLIGHLIYGVILGGGLAMLRQGVPGLTRHA